MNEIFLFALILVAGFYMAWNIGANDVANAIGTSVGSGALKLKQAVIMAAILEFCGAFFFGSHVSDTIQNGIVDPSIFVNQPNSFVLGMLSSLIAAGVWLQIASYFGWPVSATHAIVGAVVGFGAIVGGIDAIFWKNVAYIGSSWMLSPILGGLISYSLFSLLRRYIFFTTDPIAAVKRFAPVIVFFVVAILSFIMLHSIFKDTFVNFSIYQIIGLVFCCGFIGSAISYLLIKDIKIAPNVPLTSQEGVIEALNKAKNQLEKARQIGENQTSIQIERLMENINTMTHSLKISYKSKSLAENKIETIFGYLQVMSAALMAFAHGANDVANSIGPLSAAITVLSTQKISAAETPVPIWALALGGFGIVIGLSTWGWKVIETIGKKITELTPSRGFSAEFGAALTVVLASGLGLPISTTHTLVGSVIGVGLARGIEALNLGMTRDILISWFVTVPAGAILAVISYYLLSFVF
ncbi:Low-affinity inorganic phosphate transporter 1 [Candidatus Rubidus massiliensis]|nr:Low-affinity inorganic phosphate transporter 1 [Candidatus Rubidus massiliensis]